MTSSNFVLVHGAFHGGWCWRPIVRELRAGGHEVFAPSHTGLGDRAHLLSGLITIETFVKDIESLIEVEELEDVILVGHSFGARTITGVADRIPHRIRRLVYIDGGFPFDGQSRLESMPVEQRSARIARAEASGGVSIPPPPASSFGVEDEKLQAWVDRRMTPQPFGAETSRLVLKNPLGNGLPVTYVRCTEPAFPAVESSAAYARSQSQWSYVEWAAGHDAIVTHPQLAIDMLLQIAGEKS